MFTAESEHFCTHTKLLIIILRLYFERTWLLSDSTIWSSEAVISCGSSGGGETTYTDLRIVVPVALVTVFDVTVRSFQPSNNQQIKEVYCLGVLWPALTSHIRSCWRMSKWNKANSARYFLKRYLWEITVAPTNHRGVCTCMSTYIHLTYIEATEISYTYATEILKGKTCSQEPPVPYLENE